MNRIPSTSRHVRKPDRQQFRVLSLLFTCWAIATQGWANDANNNTFGIVLKAGRNVADIAISSQRKLDRGQPVYLNSIVATDRESRATLQSSIYQLLIDVAPRSRLKVRSTLDVELKGGKILISLADHLANFLRVHTDVAIFGVKGTSVRFELLADGSVLIIVYEGIVTILRRYRPSDSGPSVVQTPRRDPPSNQDLLRDKDDRSNTYLADSNLPWNQEIPEGYQAVVNSAGEMQPPSPIRSHGATVPGSELTESPIFDNLAPSIGIRPPLP